MCKQKPSRVNRLGFSFEKGVRAVTRKQERFVEEYLVDLNATQAAIRAGYSPKSASTVAGETMRNPQVRACIDTAMAKLSKRTGVSQERVIRELAKVAFVNPTDVIDFESAKLLGNATPDDTAAIASVKVKTIPTADGMGVEREIKVADKLKALELLGKHFGMFTDNIDLHGDMGVQIIDDIPNGES
ncbi:MAG: terminase small subunit [Pseudoflavonifractor sp.]